MSDQPQLSEDELAKLLADSDSNDTDNAPAELISEPPQPSRQEEKKAEGSGSSGGGTDREMTQAEIDALLASLGDD